MSQVIDMVATIGREWSRAYVMFVREYVCAREAEVHVRWASGAAICVPLNRARLAEFSGQLYCCNCWHPFS